MTPVACSGTCPRDTPRFVLRAIKGTLAKNEVHQRLSPPKSIDKTKQEAQMVWRVTTCSHWTKNIIS